MANISAPQPGNDFERDVLLRSWLAALPKVTPPVGFESNIVKRAKAQNAFRYKIIALLAVLVAIVGITAITRQVPSTVKVTYAPQSPLPLVNLYNLPPVSVVEDVRFQVQQKPRTRQYPEVVAGR